jgi:hypothetical protein
MRQMPLMPVGEVSVLAASLMDHGATDCTSALCGSSTHETIHAAHFEKV